MVDTKVVDMAAAPRSQPLDAVELGSHKGEDGLLLIAEIHHRCSGGRKQVDETQLQGIQVLHLVHLHPPIAGILVGGVVLQDVEGEDEQVLKIEQVMVGLVFLIAVGQAEFLQRLSHPPHILAAVALAVEL